MLVALEDGLLLFLLVFAGGRAFGVPKRERDFLAAVERPAAFFGKAVLPSGAVALVLAIEPELAAGVTAAGESWAGGR